MTATRIPTLPGTTVSLDNALDLANLLGEIVISGAVDTAGGNPSLLVGLDVDGITTANTLAADLPGRYGTSDLVRAIDALRVQLEHLDGEGGPATADSILPLPVDDDSTSAPCIRTLRSAA